MPWVNCPQIISLWQMPSSTARRLPCASPGALAWDQPAAGRSHLKCQLKPLCPQGNWWNQSSKCSKIFFSLLLSSWCTELGKVTNIYNLFDSGDTFRKKKKKKKNKSKRPQQASQNRSDASSAFCLLQFITTTASGNLFALTSLCEHPQSAQ